jgi:putative ABC transport system substrate-binding protein
MRRREFITLLGGTAAAWPLAARAQQPERVRRIGVRFGANPEFRGGLAVFREELQKLGWTDGQNVRIDVRGGTIGYDSARKEVAELLALAPDVILSLGGSLPVAAFQQATHTVPIVFVGVVDPVGAGFVESLARPGSNTTGFTPFEYGISAKWLELLKEIDPRVTRAAVLRDPSNPAGIGQMAAMQGAAASLGVELTPVGVRDAAEIERAIAVFTRGANGGLIVTSPASAHWFSCPCSRRMSSSAPWPSIVRRSVRSPTGKKTVGIDGGQSVPRGQRVDLALEDAINIVISSSRGELEPVFEAMLGNEADRVGPKLRLPGRHRHREHASAQGAAGIAGAADRCR